MSRVLELETAPAPAPATSPAPQETQITSPSGSGSSPASSPAPTTAPSGGQLPPAPVTLAMASVSVPMPLPASVSASPPMPMPMPMPMPIEAATSSPGNTNTQQSPELVQHAVVNIQPSGPSASPTADPPEGPNGGKSPTPAAAATSAPPQDQQAQDAARVREQQLAAQAVQQKEIDALQAHRAAIAGERTYVQCDGCFFIVLPFHALYVFAKRSLVRYNYFVYSPFLWLYLLFIFVALILDVVIRISFTILFAVMSCLGSTYRNMSDHLSTTVYTGYGYTKEEARRDAQQQRESDQGFLACIACVVYIMLIWYYYMFCVFVQLAMALAFGMVILLFSVFLEIHVAVVKYRATGFYEAHVIEKLRAIIAKNQINEAD